MSYWDLLKKQLNPEPIVKRAEKKYEFASQEFIEAFTKCAGDMSQEEIETELDKLDARYKSKH